MFNGDEGEKMLMLGENYGNKCWWDFFGNWEEIVEIDGEGCVIFICNGGSVSVWVLEEVLQFFDVGWVSYGLLKFQCVEVGVLMGFVVCVLVYVFLYFGVRCLIWDNVI